MDNFGYTNWESENEESAETPYVVKVTTHSQLGVRPDRSYPQVELVPQDLPVETLLETRTILISPWTTHRS